MLTGCMVLKKYIHMPPFALKRRTSALYMGYNGLNCYFLDFPRWRVPKGGDSEFLSIQSAMIASNLLFLAA